MNTRNKAENWADQAADQVMGNGCLAEIEAYAVALRTEHHRAVRIVRRVKYGMDPDYVGTLYADGWHDAIEAVLAALTRGRGRS